jgi:hypothetical protein
MRKILLLVLLSGCGSAVVPPDSGHSNDSGPAATDAGFDSGPIAFDAGPPAPDSGSDAGPAVADSGPRDSGPPGVDAGPPRVDAGTDSGPMRDCSERTLVFHTPGSFYTVDGLAGENPTLTLCAGTAYTFDLTDVPTFHPMQLVGGGGELIAGDASRTITPALAMPYTRYVCGNHGFGGTISVVAP